MREIVLIHTVPMIIEFINREIKNKSQNISIENIMDDKLLKLVATNEEKAIGRLNALIKIAEGDISENKEIVITCSSLSEISKKIDRKITMIDTFLHKEASKYKRILLAATAPTAIGPTKNGILKYSTNSPHIDNLIIEGAISKFKSGNKKEHDFMVTSEISKNFEKNTYDVIILCQASMAHLKESIETVTDTKVLTNIFYFIKNYI